MHVLPILLTRPHKLLRVSELLNTLLNVLRSASFLSTFVSSIWISVCLTRTLLLARLMPWISHDIWDGPFGCTFVGSLACGASIWIEQGRRRGEMSLYVLPRAIRACLSDRFLRSGKGVRLCERYFFCRSLKSLVTNMGNIKSCICTLVCHTADGCLARARFTSRAISVDTGFHNKRSQCWVLGAKKERDSSCNSKITISVEGVLGTIGHHENGRRSMYRYG